MPNDWVRAEGVPRVYLVQEISNCAPGRPRMLAQGLACLGEEPRGQGSESSLLPLNTTVQVCLSLSNTGNPQRLFLISDSSDPVWFGCCWCGNKSRGMPSELGMILQWPHIAGDISPESQTRSTFLNSHFSLSINSPNPNSRTAVLPSYLPVCHLEIFLGL